MADPNKVNMGIEIGSGLILAAGLVVLAIPFFVTGLATTAYWVDVVIGAALLAMGGFDAWAGATGRASSTWATNALCALLGLWLVGYAIYAQPGNVFLWTNVLVGAVAALVGGFDLWEAMRPAKGGKPIA